MSLTCELWDAVGPLLRTEFVARDGKPPLDITYLPALLEIADEHDPDAAPRTYQGPARTFHLAALDRVAVIFIYHQVPQVATTTTVDRIFDEFRKLVHKGP